MIQVILFIDLSKSFDTADHKLLIHKLSHYDIRGTALQWFIDYLTNYKQYDSINKINSKLAPITCDVPQIPNFRSLTIFNLHKRYC